MLFLRSTFTTGRAFYGQLIDRYKPSAFLWDMCKQWKPRSDAAERYYLLTEYSIKKPSIARFYALSGIWIHLETFYPHQRKKKKRCQV